MTEKFFENKVAKAGLKGTIRLFIQKLVGLNEYDERINTLHYFLNYYCDIKSFPKADGDLGMLQRGDTLLLKIIDIVCRKYSLPYFLTAGTYLGSVRHNGFIPWDDDTDIAMMREDYERAREILRDVLKPYGILVREEPDEPIGRIGVGYKHANTGLWIDILPYEYTTIDVGNKQLVEDYSKRCAIYKRKWRKKRKNLSREQMFRFRKKMIPEICSKDEAKTIINCPEFGAKSKVWSLEMVFPLRRVQFEDAELSAPRTEKDFLIQFYGENYMGFPQSGLLHHGDPFIGLAGRAKATGTSMTEVIKELETIIHSLQRM